MAIRMPVMSGIDATTRIAAAHPTSRVLILTTFDLDEYIFAGPKAGASGSLFEDAATSDLLAAIRAMRRG